MRLNTAQRIAALLLAVFFLALSIASNWQEKDSAATAAYGVIAGLLFLVAVARSLPELEWKGHGLIWPPLDVLEKVERTDAAIAGMTEAITKLMQAADRQHELFMDHLRAQQPRPEGYEHTEYGEPFESDEQLLEELERTYWELSNEAAGLAMDGEADKEGVFGMRDGAHQILQKERRRQAARKHMRTVMSSDEF